MSRRTLLGAAVALPFSSLPLDGGGKVGVDSDVGRGVSGASPGSAATPTLPSPIEGEGDWRSALCAFRVAEAAVEEAGRVCASASRAGVGAAEDLFGDRLEALYGALRGLFVVPAPDVAALLVKVELAFEHEIATLSGSAPAVAAVREDVRRLTAAEAGDSHL